MDATNAASNQQQFDEIMARLGAARPTGAVAGSLEDAMRTPAIAPTTREGPSAPQLALPIVTPDMTLAQIADLFDQYQKVLDAGAYLSVWTGMKAVPRPETDPVSAGYNAMSLQERRGYEWWESKGSPEVFNWDLCTKEGSTSEAKSKKFAQQLWGMRVMFKLPELDAGNLYWLRANRATIFQVVCAYAKIVGAANDITQDVNPDKVFEYKEYQTCTSLCGTADTVVNEFMKNLHVLTQRIQFTRDQMAARRYWAGTACGKKMKSEGTANRQAAQRGLPQVGVVTRPSDAPVGAKETRNDIRTLKDLRALRLGKRVRDDRAEQEEDDDENQGSVRKDRRIDETTGGAGSSTAPVVTPPPLPLNRANTMRIVHAYDNNAVGNTERDVIANLHLNKEEQAAFYNIEWDATSGHAVPRVPAAGTGATYLAARVLGAWSAQHPDRLGEISTAITARTALRFLQVTVGGRSSTATYINSEGSDMEE